MTVLTDPEQEWSGKILMISNIYKHLNHLNTSRLMG